MRLSRVRPLLAVVTALALIGPGAALTARAAPAPAGSPAGDATVIAVIDSGFSPYHRDFLAARMPPEVRLPLTAGPHTWLPGFPAPSSFASYAPLQLTLDPAEGAELKKLHERDKAQWASVKESATGAVHFRYIPGTKVIGALSFGDLDDRAAGTVHGEGAAEHGMGAASTAVGNVHGTCPQCLLVFLQYTTRAGAEQALTWAHEQPWIDAVTNSYGFSTTPGRDRVYNGTDVVAGRAASVRGQTTFFSAGNGLDNAYTVPTTTLLSSQEGPDWVVTVGGTGADDDSLTGTGKPVDVAAVVRDYPSSRHATTTSNGKPFSGTSNATPLVAGVYGRALWEARRALPGGSRRQSAGLVAAGVPAGCGVVRPGCELVDGRLTATELRTRVLHGALPTEGLADGASGLLRTPSVADERYANQGHGTYRGRLDQRWDATLSARVLGPLLGSAASPSRPEGEVEWFRVDSACRQHLWGTWSGGYYLDEKRTPQPQQDLIGWPTRTAIQRACPMLSAPPPAT